MKKIKEKKQNNTIWRNSNILLLKIKVLLYRDYNII